MPYKRLHLALAATVLSATTQAQTAPDAPVSLGQDKQQIVGLWAMRALSEGTTNVAEFRANGQLLLHPFNCVEGSRGEAEAVTYTVADDGRVVNMVLPTKTYPLKVLNFSPDAMKLVTQVGNKQVWYDFVKTDAIDSVCARYPELAEERARQTPYQDSDFVPAPIIPEHPDMDRYIGTWGFGNTVEVQIARDANGRAYLNTPGDSQWHYLYNDVHWVGNALHFQRYSYSSSPEMYRFPKHKLLSPNILQPLPDGTLRQDFVNKGEPYAGVLNRMKD